MQYKTEQHLIVHLLLTNMFKMKLLHCHLIEYYRIVLFNRFLLLFCGTVVYRNTEEAP